MKVLKRLFWVVVCLLVLIPVSFLFMVSTLEWVFRGKADLLETANKWIDYIEDYVEKL
jgi:hypothetical protein